MSEITLKDILVGARQESYRMRHYYVGAEHLFIALLGIKGSLIGSIVEERGLPPDYVIDAIRRKIGKGGKHRLWAGVPNTPRADILLGIANDLALEAGHEEINERDLLMAILEEDDNIPVRVLKALGIHDVLELTQMVRTFTPRSDSQQVYVKVDLGGGFDSGAELLKEQTFLLRQLFNEHRQIRVDYRLKSDYSTATLLMVTPIRANPSEVSAAVVKIDQVDAIIDEAQRYETFVKSKLPEAGVRVINQPVTSSTSDQAAIKYVLPAEGGSPQELAAVILKWEAPKLGEWLQNRLFSVYGQYWWQQRKAYRFQIWREYDWMLPPILTLELVKEKSQPTDAQLIRVPVSGTKIRRLRPGDVVALENFSVDKIYPASDMIQLIAAQGSDATKAYKVEIDGVDLRANTYYRGEVVESIIGRVRQTRREKFIQALQALDPNFDPTSGEIQIAGSDTTEKLPNPLFAYGELGDSSFNGAQSAIHGNLHIGNILVGANEAAFVVDYAHLREGHTVFDWAVLETSLLTDILMPMVGESWKDAHTISRMITTFDKGDATGDAILMPTVKLREIAQKCLLTEEDWSEYLIALTFCGLRATTWETLSIGSRRLMFLVAAAAIHKLRRLRQESKTPAPD